MTGSFQVMQWTPLNRLLAADGFRGERDSQKRLLTGTTLNFQ